MKRIIRYIGILGFIFCLFNCNRGVEVFYDVNDDKDIYNEVVHKTIDYIIQNEIFENECDTFYVDPYIRIDTNSIHTYGVRNALLYYDHIDSSNVDKRTMSREEYNQYRFIQEIRTYREKHNFDNMKFDFPVKFFPLEKSGKNVLSSHVNIISPLIRTKFENVYNIWITKWIVDPYIDRSLWLSLVIEDGNVNIRSHHYYKESDLQSMLLFTDPDYIRDLK